MNDLSQTKLFGLLSKNLEVTAAEMQNAYGRFTEQIENLNQPENEYTAIYRELNLTRIELVSLSNHFRYEQGEKCA